MYKIWSLPLLLVGLVGCTAQSLQVDVSQAIYAAPLTNISKAKLSAITIKNKPGDGKKVKTAHGSDSVVPIETAKPTEDTIEEDIRRYLQERTVISDESNKSLRVIIHKADSYWVWIDAVQIPIFGLFFVNTDTEYGLNLKVVFEVEENGKIVRSYLFDDVITIQAKVASQEQISEAYEILIEKYRDMFFSELDSEFVYRYM